MNYQDKNNEELLKELLFMKEENIKLNSNLALALQENENFRQEESRYERFFEDNHSVMLLINPETGKIRDANPAACDFYGWTRAEIQKKNIAEINTLSPDDLRVEMQKAITDKRRQFFFKHRLASGEVRDVEVFAGPINFDNSTYLYSIVHDISERRQVENALTQNEEKFAKAFLTAPYAITITRIEDGKLVEVNDAFTQICGYTKEEALADSSVGLGLWVDINDRNRIIKTLKESGRFSEEEIRFRRKDGEIIIGAMSSSLLQINNKDYVFSSINDITKRKQAEEKLRISEEKYRSVFETIQDVYYEASIEGIILEISPSIEKVSKSQLTRDELLGQSLIGMYAEPEARQNFYEQLTKQGSVTDYELLFKYKDGSLAPVSISSVLLFDNSGKPLKITGTIRDITERKQNEKLLQESKALYQSILDASPDDITIADLEGTVIYVSSKALSMFGYENVNQIIGKNLIEFIAPEDIEKAKVGTERMLQGNPIGTIEYKAIRADNSIFDVEVNGEFIRDEEGKPIKVVYIVRDVTQRKLIENELKEKELQYSILADSGQALIWTASPDKKCDYFNKVWLDFTGRTLEQEVGDGWAEGVHPEDLSRCFEIYSTAFDKREEFSMIYRLRRFDGEYCWILDDGKPRYNSNGEFIGYIGHCLDITERKQAEDELKNSEEKYRKDLQLLNSIFESPVNIIVFSLDTNYCYTAFTKYHEQTMKLIWGVDIKVGMNMLEIISNPDDREKAKQNFDRVFNGEYFVLTEEYGDDNLHRTYYEDFYSPVKNSSGEIIGVSVFVIDATERYQASKKLETSEERFSQVVAQSKEVVWEVDDKDIYTYISPVSKDIYGYTPEEMIGKMTFYDLLPVAQREYFKEFATELLEGHLTLQNYISTIINADGTERIINTNGIRLVNDKGEVTGFRGITSDITNQVKAEKELLKFRTIADQANYGVVISNLEGTFLYVNDTYAKMLGWEVDDLLGKNSTAVHNKEQTSRIEEIISLMKSNSGFASEELYHTRKDGSTFPALMSSKVIFDENHIPTFISATVIDISDRKKAEENLIKENRLRMVLSQINLTIIKEKNKNKLLESVCRIAVDYGKFQMAWIGLIDDESTKIKPFIIKGFEAGYFSAIDKISTNVDSEWYERANEMLREGRTFICNDIENDPRMLLRKDESLKRNYRSSIILPIKQFGLVFGSFSLYSSVAYFFNDEEVSLLSEITDNITYAFEAIETENERLRAEDELRKLSSAVEQSSTMTVITNLNGTIEYINPALTKVTGYTKSEVLGRNPSIFSSGERTKADYQELWETISSGKEWRGEFHNKKKNGESYWAGALITPIFDTHGKISHYVSVEEDITLRKQIEKELLELNANLERKVEERTHQLNQAKLTLEEELEERIRIENVLRWNQSLLNLMSDSSPLAFLVVDNRTDEILYFNHRFCEIWGIEHLAERMNKGELKNNDIIPFCLPVLADIPAFAESCKPLQFVDNRLVLEDEIPFTENRTVRRFSTQIRGENDEYFGRFYIFEDISERKRAEEDLHTQIALLDAELNSTIDGVLVVDDNNKRLLINQQMINLFNVPASVLEEDDDTKLLEYVFSLVKDQEKFMNRVQHLYKQFNEYSRDEIELKNGIILDSYSAPVLGQNGKNYGRIWSFRDITESKNAAKALELARNEAESANVAKSEFLSRMSHELRTPMNSILGFAQLLNMGELNINQKKGVNHILNSGKHLLELINQVLHISRIEAGRLSISIEPVQLKGVFDDVMDIIKPLTIQQQISIKFSDFKQNQFIISADRQSVKQILLNLLNNAIKYNKQKGSVTIKTETKSYRDNEPDYVRISISDTGVGIKPEDIPKLFTPFERIGFDNSLIEGTGLGLAVVKKLVEVMGGFCGVESVPRKGSTFWIELPIAEEQDLKTLKIKELAVTESNISEKQGTILYIEDNMPNVELIKQILFSQRPGIDLITCTNGKETVNLAIKYKPELILLDLNLPDIFGGDVLKLLLENKKTKDIPVIVVSADGMEHQIEKLTKAGAKKYLTKPLEVSVFLSMIDEIIKN
ncbi:MAG: PAS domain S-box protein [Paludibacter sp.]